MCAHPQTRTHTLGGLGADTVSPDCPVKLKNCQASVCPFARQKLGRVLTPHGGMKQLRAPAASQVQLCQFPSFNISSLYIVLFIFRPIYSCYAPYHHTPFIVLLLPWVFLLI